MSVTKAVLLAAGRGTRLGALTANFPKPLLTVGGRPIIAHILDGLVAAGIEDVVVVTGHFASLVEAELGNGEPSGLRLKYVRQERLEGTARALSLAREFCGDEQFFFSWGDILVRPENYRVVLQSARFAEHVLAVNEVEDPASGAAVYVDKPAKLAVGEPARVVGMVEKPAPGTSTTRWNNAGFGVLGPAIWDAIERLEPSPRGEYELPQAMAALIEGGADVRAVPVTGPWFDVGTSDDLEAARAEFRGHSR
ncbi:MAG TPA: sugar phosphate nucleotidyltransferase [Tepidiformaceae bacterium]|nr:sugar phosphate nucleotidyltransferase [Tepidiformaceae bacterium]